MYGTIERLYPHAKFIRSSNTFDIVPSQDTPSVRWSSVLDPSMPDSLPASVSPIRVRLRPGEALYLPAGWWHYVQQAKEVTIAINWWYDMEMRGAHWVFLNFLRSGEGLYIDDHEDGAEVHEFTDR